MDLTMLRYRGYIHFQPHFINPSASKGFENVTLESKEHEKFHMNALTFASTSQFCYEVLKASEETDSNFYIKTEFSSLELYKICAFITTGQIFGYQAKDELLRDMNTVNLFHSIGVNLINLMLEWKGVTEHWWRQYEVKQETNNKENLDKPWWGIEKTHRNKAPMCDNLQRDESIKEIKKEGMDISGYEDIEIKPNHEDIANCENEDYDDNYLNDVNNFDGKFITPEITISSRSKASCDDDDWTPDIEDKPLKRNKAKGKHKIQKCRNQKIRNEKGVKRAHGESNLFWFPQDESLRDLKLQYQCTLCVRGFEQAPSLKQHIKRHGAKCEDDRYFCIYCEEYTAFYKVSDMKQHVKEKHRDSKVSCPYCNKTYSIQLKHLLKDHIKSNHTNGAYTICPSCGSELKGKIALQEHLKRLGPFHDTKCRICPEFEAKTWEENLKHVNTHHNGDVQFKCGYCPEYFFDSGRRKAHFKVCTGDTKSKKKELEATRVMCPFCAKMLTKGGIQPHIDREHGTHQIKCTEPGCEAVLKHPQALKAHIKAKHTSACCPECGWVGEKKRLKRHVQMQHTKTERMPHVCEICHKGFVESIKYQDHMNVHNGLKPHKCTVCGQGFASLSTMYGHRRSVHFGIKRK